MDVTAGGVAELVFKQAIRGDVGNLSLDGQMLSVLMAFDGKKNLDQIAQNLGMNLRDIQSIVAHLVKLNLIDRVETAVEAVDEDFVKFLISQLSHALGPLGAIVVEDEIEDMGFSSTTFPVPRVAELINILAQEIQREDKRIDFKQVMLKKLKEKGY